MKATLAKVKSRYWVPAVAGAGMLANTAFAADPVTTLLEGVDLSGASAKVAAVGLLVVGIYFATQAVSIAKRIIARI